MLSAPCSPEAACFVAVYGPAHNNVWAKADALLIQVPRAGVLKPSYVIVRDRQLNSIVLAIRGTHSVKVGAFFNLQRSSWL